MVPQCLFVEHLISVRYRSKAHFDRGELVVLNFYTDMTMETFIHSQLRVILIKLGMAKGKATTSMSRGHMGDLEMLIIWQFGSTYLYQLLVNSTLAWY